MNEARYEPRADIQAALRTGLTNWDPQYRIALGNEFAPDAIPPTDDDVYARPWRGTIHRVALFDRALDETEVIRYQSLERTQ